MQNKQKGLSNFQVSALVSLTVIGMTIVFIPRIAAEQAGIDGALATFLAGILSIVLAGVIITISKRFPNQTVMEFSQEILGTILGKLYGLVFVLHSTTVVAYILRGFADALKVLLLPRTPLEITMICMLLIILYCVHGGISTIVRTCEIFLLPLLLVIVPTILFNLPEVELFRYRSSLSNGITPLLQGVVSVTVAYLGYEILFFILPFTQNKKKFMISGVSGMILPVLIYTGLVFVMVGVLGHKATSELAYPTIQLARRIGIEFIERFDILFIVFWILAVFTSLTSYLYMASISFTRWLGMRNYKPFILILLPICYIIAILPQDISEINMLGKIINYVGFIIVLSSIPLLILSMIRKKGGKANAEKN
ncbi:MAG: endospore germination permease [Clostridiales bacterium]|nr:endospore germination permease [Clostridiales bacterium]